MEVVKDGEMPAISIKVSNTVEWHCYPARAIRDESETGWAILQVSEITDTGNPNIPKAHTLYQWANGTREKKYNLQDVLAGDEVVNFINLI